MTSTALETFKVLSKLDLPMEVIHHITKYNRPIYPYIENLKYILSMPSSMRVYFAHTHSDAPGRRAAMRFSSFATMRARAAARANCSTRSAASARWRYRLMYWKKCKIKKSNLFVPPYVHELKGVFSCERCENEQMTPMERIKYCTHPQLAPPLSFLKKRFEYKHQYHKF